MKNPQRIRLSLDAAEINTLLQHPLLSALPKRQRLHLTHFDTADHALASLGISVDETRVLRKTTLTVQHPTDNGCPWSAPTSAGSFDFATLIDIPETAEQLSQFTDRLIPIFTIDTRQRQWPIQIRRAQIDVILEDGTIVVGNEASPRSRQFCEIELRLNSGHSAALYGVARLLSRQLRLHPISDNLMDRALGFCLNKDTTPIKARRVKVEPRDTVIEVFKHLAWQCLNQLQGNEAGVFTTNNIEFIHQARVALRRLRTALRLFGTELPPGFSDKWSQAWRDVAEQLGNARNWDVFCSEILPDIAIDLGDHPDLVHLKRFAEAERDKAHVETQQWLHGRRYSLITIAFSEALLSIPDRNADRIDHFADKALKKRYKRFCSGARVAHTLSSEERHEVRIELKKLRYTLDFFESLYPQKRLQPFLVGLAKTQELLGHMNDLVTGETLLALRPGALFDLPVAWTKGRMSGYLETLPAALKPVLDAKTPW